MGTRSSPSARKHHWERFCHLRGLLPMLTFSGASPAFGWGVPGGTSGSGAARHTSARSVELQSVHVLSRRDAHMRFNGIIFGSALPTGVWVQRHGSALRQPAEVSAEALVCTRAAGLGEPPGPSSERRHVPSAPSRIAPAARTAAAPRARRRNRGDFGRSATRS